MLPRSKQYSRAAAREHSRRPGRDGLQCSSIAHEQRLAWIKGASSRPEWLVVYYCLLQKKPQHAGLMRAAAGMPTKHCRTCACLHVQCKEL